MSKQFGLVKLDGRLGDVSFYSQNGVHRARLAKGIKKGRILTDPSFERTRENISEFQGLAMAVKSFGTSIQKVSNFKDRDRSTRLRKVFRTIMKRADALRGQRPVLISQNRDLLQGFELKSDVDLLSVFSSPIMTTNASRTSVKTDVSPKRDQVTPPPGATHYRLVQLLAPIADTVYNAEVKTFAPSTELGGMSEVTYSDYIPVRAVADESISLETTLDAPALADDVTVLLGLGIVFYEKTGSEYYSLAQNSAMKIVGVL
jgi:hypothetical protein